jgi:hypothetical protein
MIAPGQQKISKRIKIPTLNFFLLNISLALLEVLDEDEELEESPKIIFEIGFT